MNQVYVSVLSLHIPQMPGCGSPVWGTATINPMAGLTRRVWIVSGIAAVRLFAEGKKGEAFASDSGRYPDPLTELDVYRLTKPDYSTSMTAYPNRGIARNSSWMLCCCDRTGAPQAFHLDLKGGEMKQLTDTHDLDGTTLTLAPDNRQFCYFAGRSLYIVNV